MNTGEELKRLSVMGDAELAREASDLERRARLARGVMCRRSQARAVAREIEAGTPGLRVLVKSDILLV